MKAFGFDKTERLKSRKRIDALFTNGAAFNCHPIRVVYRFVPGGTGQVLAGVSATKKHFKKAVDRNRIKRLLREAYRLQKQALTAAAGLQAADLDVFFLFTGKTLPRFEVVKTAMAASLQQLQQKLLKLEKPA